MCQNPNLSKDPPCAPPSQIRKSQSDRQCDCSLRTHSQLKSTLTPSTFSSCTPCSCCTESSWLEITLSRSLSPLQPHIRSSLMMHRRRAGGVLRGQFCCRSVVEVPLPSTSIWQSVSSAFSSVLSSNREHARYKAMRAYRPSCCQMFVSGPPCRSSRPGASSGKQPC